MEDSILDVVSLSTFFKNKEWDSVRDFLIKTAKTIASNRRIVNIEMLELMSKILHGALSDINNLDVIQVVTECFRALRNSCVEEKENQLSLATKTTAVDDTFTILNTISSLPAEKHNVDCIRSGVQFLGNLIVNNTENQKIVWNTCSVILMDLLKYEDDKVANCSCMVLYNILLGHSNLSMEQGIHILKLLIDHAMKDSEFAMYTVELLLHREGYLEKVYLEVEDNHRLFLLEVVHSLISTNEDKSDSSDSSVKVPISSVCFLTQQFKRRSDCILKTCEKYVEQVEPVEVAKLLDLTASASSNSPYLEELQKDKSLLINCAFLLKNIHLLGKSSNNSFSTVQKLSELSIGSKSSEMEKHPAFGFKGMLVRLLGNLCWNHRENQDEVRELDCIPLLLDCCNIDARNPLIIQWVVLTMRNLCANNLENQEVVASMTRQGTVDSSVLRELGLTLHSDGDKSVGILPLSR